MEGKDFSVTPRNAEELFLAAMNQDLLNRLQVITKHAIKRKPRKRK